MRSLHVLRSVCLGCPLPEIYCGLLVDETSAPAFKRIFEHAQCECDVHTVRLQGYDESGVSRTSAAAAYVPKLAQGLASAIVDAIRDRSFLHASDSAYNCHLRSLGHSAFVADMQTAHVSDLTPLTAPFAAKVSETGAIEIPKTFRQARASPHWPLFRDAIDKEITG